MIHKLTLPKAMVKASLSKGRFDVDVSSGIVLPKDIKFKTPFSFCKIDTGSTFKLRYLAERWVFFNRELFGGTMKEPVFLIGKAFTDPRALGVWRQYQRTLTLAQKLFILPNDKQLLGTLVHEMAHQYDSEVLKTPLMELLIKRGHGPSWDAIMQAIGMPADDRFVGDSSELMNAEQKENLEHRKAPEAANKITPDSFGAEQYIRALYVSLKGNATPVILVNKKATSSLTSDMYLAFDKKDVATGYHQWLRLSSCIKPTAMQLRKFPPEFNSVRALELIDKCLNY